MSYHHRKNSEKKPMSCSVLLEIKNPSIAKFSYWPSGYSKTKDRAQRQDEA